MKVLILEHDPVIANNYAIFASKYCGHTALIGNDGTFLNENWYEVQTCDIIVIDADMPMNGLECLKFLAERSWKKPVLIQHTERWFGDHHLIDLNHVKHTYPFATFKKKQWDGSNLIYFLEKHAGKYD